MGCTRRDGSGETKQRFGGSDMLSVKRWGCYVLAVAFGVLGAGGAGNLALADAQVAPEVIDAIQREGRVRVMFALVDPDERVPFRKRADFDATAQIAALRARLGLIPDAQPVADSQASTGAKQQIPNPEIDGPIEFPAFQARGGHGFATIDSVGLSLLRNAPEVERINLIATAEFSDVGVWTETQMFALQQQFNLTGQNVRVAVLDGNIQTLHPALQGRVSPGHELCFGVRATNSSPPPCSACPPDHKSQSDPSTPCIVNSIPPSTPGAAAGEAGDDWTHGTAVAGLIAAQGGGDPPAAPAGPTTGVKLTAIRITQRSVDPQGNVRHNPTAELIGHALAWIEEYNDKQSLDAEKIKVVNMSLNESLSQTDPRLPYNYNMEQHACDNHIDVGGWESVKIAVQRLQRAGVQIIVSSGNELGKAEANDTLFGGMAAPACFSTVIGVSGVWEADQFSYLANDVLPASVTRYRDPVNQQAFCVPLAGRNACYAERSWLTHVAAPSSVVTLPWTRFVAVNRLHTSNDYFFNLMPRDQIRHHGTSFAAPLVSACIAQLIEGVPGLDPRDVTAAISREPELSTTWNSIRQDNNGTRFVNDPYTLPLLRCANARQRLLTQPRGIPANRFALSGAWYDPSTPVQGLVLTVNPENPLVFGAWYTYRAAGQPSEGGMRDQRWVTLQSSQGWTPSSGDHWVPLQVGRPLSGGTFNSADPVDFAVVGNARLRFHNCNQATLAYSFDLYGAYVRSQGMPDSQPGDPPAIQLERLLPEVRCAESETSQQQLNLATDWIQVDGKNFGISGPWAHSPPAGVPNFERQGLLAEINPVGPKLRNRGYPFFGWFTYRAANSPPSSHRSRWFTLEPALPEQFPETSGPTVEIKLNIGMTTGGVFRSQVAVTQRAVGTATLRTPRNLPDRCRTGELSYQFALTPEIAAEGYAGLSGSIPLARLDAVPASFCRLASDPP